MICRVAIVSLIFLSGMSQAEAQEVEEPDQEDHQAGRQHFEHGLRHVGNEEWEAALSEFEASLQSSVTQVASFNRALCIMSLNRHTEALQAFDEFLETFGNDVSEERRNLINELTAEIRAGLSEITIVVNLPGASIFVDDEEIGVSPLSEPLLLEAGSHQVEARLDGYPTAQVSLSTISGSPTEVVLEFEERGATEEPTVEVALQEHVVEEPQVQRSRLNPAGFWSMVGLTAVGAVGVVALGAVTISMDAEYRENINRTAAERDSGNSMVIATDITLGISIATAIAALVLFFFTDFGSRNDTSDLGSSASLEPFQWAI